MQPDGRIRIEDIVDYFIDFYENRRAKNLYVENAKSLFSKTEYSRKDVEKLIFRNPFDVMSQMNFVKRDINIEWISLNHPIMRLGVNRR